MVTMQRSYRFRAYPSSVQKERLNRQMFLSKQVYNILLEKAQNHFKETGKTFTKYDMNKWIAKLKKENPEFKEVYSQSLQNVSDRLSKAYRNFFRRIKERKRGRKIKVGFPRFRSFVSSLTYPQSGFKIEKKRITLSKVGRINFVNHREILGTVKTFSIKRTKVGEWYVTFSSEIEDTPPFSNNRPRVGMDLGLTEYATLSNGLQIKNPKMQNALLTRLKRRQKRISSKKKGSRNRRKAIIGFAGLSEHVVRQRDDYLHKISSNLVNSYSFIAYEELNVQNMVRNHNLARHIQDASWNKFIQFLCYKAESAGCRAVGVNPRGTSRICSGCGNVQDMPLSERAFNCDKCGMSKDRDLNASINILERATEGQSGSYASGDSASASQKGKASGIVESGTILGGAS